MKGAVKTAPFSRSSTLVRRSVYGCSDSGALGGDVSDNTQIGSISINS
jgi:hypothetical protein